MATFVQATKLKNSTCTFGFLLYLVSCTSCSSSCTRRFYTCHSYFGLLLSQLWHYAVHGPVLDKHWKHQLIQNAAVQASIGVSCYVHVTNLASMNCTGSPLAFRCNSRCWLLLINYIYCIFYSCQPPRVALVRGAAT